jgi:hypothetical protein
MQCETALAAVGSRRTAAQKCVGDEKTEGLEKIRERVEGGDLPECFLKTRKGGTAEENRGKSLEKRCDVLHAEYVLIPTQESEENLFKHEEFRHPSAS